MTDDEAREALAKLEKHFGQPVVPMSFFCAQLVTWLEVMTRWMDASGSATHVGGGSCHWAPGMPKPEPRFWTGGEKVDDAKIGAELKSGNLYNMNVARIARSFLTGLYLRKSNFAWRLLYDRENLRTVVCPNHKGSQNNAMFTGDPCACDGTGWLPAEPRQHDIVTWWKEKYKR